MGTATEGGDLNASISQFAAATVDAYRQMRIPIRQYLLLIVLPSFVVFALTVAVAVTVDLPLLARLPIPLLGALAVGVALVYPKLLRDQKRREMEGRLHLFITHMTILSTTNVDRVEVFRLLSEESEYEALAEEAKRVVELVDTWNQSLDDACRIRARKVPSKPVSDLLDRLSYTISAGQELHTFLLGEQSAVIQKYVTIYEGALANLEVMKDLYLSMILSVTFALVFSTVLPILTATNPTYTVSAVVVMFAFIQAGFLLAIRSIAPSDPLWFHPDEYATTIERHVRVSVVSGVLLSLALIVGCLAVLMGETSIARDSIPLAFYAAIPTTPLLIPGVVLRHEEKRVRQRDEEFVNFIRALGASESAKQSTTSNVLETLRKKDFGALTGNVDDLYKRLNMRIATDKAWEHFAADCRSMLIQKFSQMYLVGRGMGGEPKQLGELISTNMNEVIQLRERRTQSTTTLIGVLYGITAASTFAFFIGLQVVDILSDMSMSLSTGQLNVGGIIHTGVYDIAVIEFLLILIILLNAMLSSLMIRIADGGHKVNAYLHFVLLTWVSAGVAVLTKHTVGAFINV